MPRHVALLRAINVGGHTVKMDRLRTLFAELGFANVETFIASGNVIFDAKESDGGLLERRIERHLAGALGYEVATFLRSPGELAAIAGQRPFAGPGVDEASQYVAFLSGTPKAAARRKLMEFRCDVDDFHVRGREVFWLCRTSLSQSAFSGALLEKTLALPATLRNITTVRKLASKYAGASAGGA